MISLDNSIKVSTLIQNILMSLALCIGGLWAYNTFIYENPSFSGVGSKPIYRDALSIYSEINYKLLSKDKKLYEVRITLENNSLKNSILVNYSDVALMYRKINSLKNMEKEVDYERISGKNEGFWVAINQKRYLTYLVEFKKSGTYIVEFDYCTRTLTDCLVNTYINVK